MWHCSQVILLPVAALAIAGVSGQQYNEFRPQGYSELQPLDIGRGPDPLNIALQLSQVGVTSPLCEGMNDVLTVTLPAPVVGPISPQDLTVMACPMKKIQEENFAFWQPVHDECEIVVSACLDLQLSEAVHERRTIRLYGQFVQFEGKLAKRLPVNIRIPAVTFLINGEQSVYGSGEATDAYSPGHGFSRNWNPDPTEPVLGYGEGPFLADATLVNLSAPLNTPSRDPNGCAALHPSATYAVRLLFASGVHERGPANNTLAPFAPDPTTAAAMFSIRIGLPDAVILSPDRVVGTAGASREAEGSVVDVCVEGDGEAPQVEAVVINCTEAAPLSPAGFPCTTPIKAYLRSESDQDADRDPAMFAAPDGTIEFCLGEPENCPGAAPAPAGIGNMDAEVPTSVDDGAASGTGSAKRSLLAFAAAAFVAAAVLAGTGAIV